MHCRCFWWLRTPAAASGRRRGSSRAPPCASSNRWKPRAKKLVALALATARDFDLRRYIFGSADPERGGFDCSGSMFYLLKTIGLEPARSSAAQFEWLKREGTLHTVPAEVESIDDEAFHALKPGDLIFWAGTYRPTDGRKNKVTHVQMYLGREKSDGRRVMIGSTDGRSYRGTARCGYGVFDLRLPRPGSKARIIGYGTPPGLSPEPAR